MSSPERVPQQRTDTPCGWRRCTRRLRGFRNDIESQLCSAIWKDYPPRRQRSDSGALHGTILSRLSRAREQLRRRLTQRGRVEFAGILLGACVPHEATTALPTALLNSTVQAAAARHWLVVRL